MAFFKHAWAIFSLTWTMNHILIFCWLTWTQQCLPFSYRSILNISCQSSHYSNAVLCRWTRMHEFLLYWTCSIIHCDIKVNKICHTSGHYDSCQDFVTCMQGSAAVCQLLVFLCHQAEYWICKVLQDTISSLFLLLNMNIHSLYLQYILFQHVYLYFASVEIS